MAQEQRGAPDAGGAGPGLPGSASRAADSDCDQGRVNVFGGKKLVTAEVLDADEKERGTWQTKEKGKAPGRSGRRKSTHREGTLESLRAPHFPLCLARSVCLCEREEVERAV